MLRVEMKWRQETVLVRTPHTKSITRKEETVRSTVSSGEGTEGDILTVLNIGILVI